MIIKVKTRSFVRTLWVRRRSCNADVTVLHLARCSTVHAFRHSHSSLCFIMTLIVNVLDLWQVHTMSDHLVLVTIPQINRGDGGYRNLRIATNNKTETHEFFCKRDITSNKRYYTVNIPLTIHTSIETWQFWCPFGFSVHPPRLRIFKVIMKTRLKKVFVVKSDHCFFQIVIQTVTTSS